MEFIPDPTSPVKGAPKTHLYTLLFTSPAAQKNCIIPGVKYPFLIHGGCRGSAAPSRFKRDFIYSTDK